jgi:hypothetical protein
MSIINPQIRFGCEKSAKVFKIIGHDVFGFDGVVIFSLTIIVDGFACSTTYD